MKFMRDILNILEAADPSQDLRAEIKKLHAQVPSKWINKDGKEVWKIQQIDHAMNGASPEELQNWLSSYAATVEFLKKNPKNVLPDPFSTKMPRKKMASLKAMAPRVGKPFETWLANTYEDIGDMSANDRLEAIAEYLRDEHSVDIRDDGLIEFWTLDQYISRVIGDQPVALFHYTASGSGVLKGIRTNGLVSGMESINDRKIDGVYVTTETSGPAVQGYSRRAVSEHGGRPITVTVKLFLDELEADPDDADLSSGRHQFRVEHVPAERIVSINSISL